MNDFNVMDLVKNIDETRTQTGANAKDENRVMQAMLNDPSFKVDVWNKNGVTGQYCPYDDARSLVANIIKDTTKISSNEATALAGNYIFGKQEASTFINISKEFVNTYMETGRKLPLGGRESSNISIARKTKELKDGSGKKYGSAKVYSPAPVWVKNK